MAKRPPMSVQLVHLDSETTVVIVEVRVVVGKENPAMKAILANVPPPGKAKTTPKVRIDAMDFLPADLSF
jgi:carbonic anhydrase